MYVCLYVIILFTKIMHKTLEKDKDSPLGLIWLFYQWTKQSWPCIETWQETMQLSEKTVQRGSSLPHPFILNLKEPTKIYHRPTKPMRCSTRSFLAARCIPWFPWLISAKKSPTTQDGPTSSVTFTFQCLRPFTKLWTVGKVTMNSVANSCKESIHFSSNLLKTFPKYQR